MLLGRDRNFDSLRSDAAFEQLLAKLGPTTGS